MGSDQQHCSERDCPWCGPLPAGAAADELVEALEEELAEAERHVADARALIARYREASGPDPARDPEVVPTYSGTGWRKRRGPNDYGDTPMDREASGGE